MANGMLNSWEAYRPTKAVWLWSCVGAVATTMIVGFSAGGWVTGGTAAEQTEAATGEAVAQLAAGICAKRFLAADDSQIQLTALEKTDTWRRNTFIEEGGWVTFANMKEPVNGAAVLCAEQLLASS